LPGPLDLVAGALEEELVYGPRDGKLKVLLGVACGLVLACELVISFDVVGGALEELAFDE
jgi:hypothetical protein